MARVKNISGEALSVPALGGRAVLVGQVVEVPDAESYGYTQQLSTWEAADDAARSAHDEHAPAEDEPTPDSLSDAPADLEEPAGNASRDEWASYVLVSGKATAEDIEDMGRDQIRDTYGSN